MSQSPTALAGVVLLLALLTGGRQTVLADSPAALAQFENEVRPVLVDRCLKCHGPKKAESGLRLDTRAAALRGGDSGPAIIPGKPGTSLLLKGVRHVGGLEMPPGDRLKPREIAALEQWIKDGAVWPENTLLSGAPALRSGAISRQERAFWSLQPLADPQPPAVEPARPVHNAIDRFVQAKLVSAGLRMREPADRRTLLRRVTFDLTGLPPTPAETEAFLSDPAPNAWNRVIDRLLGSTAYGERWGRHWLDVVRYADTAGETADYPTPLSYKYRNWVIQAFNADMPYDEFVRWQIAGDLLAQEEHADTRKAELIPPARYRDQVTATGFIAISRRFGFDVENYHHLTIQDTIDVVGQSILGLSPGCARCHDHKYDPINMSDYYAWYGIFASTRYSFPGSEEKKRPYDSFLAVPPASAAARQTQFDRHLAEITAEIKQIEAELKSPQGSSTPGDLQRRHKERTAQRQALVKAGPFAADEFVYGAKDHDRPADANIQLRGEKTRTGPVAPRRNLEILGEEPVRPDAGSGRKQLAEWLTRPTNPLTARVMVNRIWQHHFGRGLVGTENDFGARGERPSHPELLDWLASRFIQSGWSVKAMHRLILASRAYQQSSSYDAAAAELDPDAKLLWRFNLRRLGAEEIRDAMLLVSGNLDTSPGGPHPFPQVEAWGFTQHAPFYAVYPTNRRSVYLMQQRLKRHPFVALFDGADPNASIARRGLTTVPTQALFLMNNEFVHEQSAAFTRQLIHATTDPARRIELAYTRALGRPVTAGELSAVMEFLAAHRDAARAMKISDADSERIVWEAFARTLLIRNEFLHVD